MPWRCWSSTCWGFWLSMLLQRLQGILPLNPQGLAAVSPDSSFNTAVSFATNTNWQGYGGETTMSYLTQMLALTVQNFVSAATGMAVLVALASADCPSHGADDRQFLGRPDAFDALHPAAARHRARPGARFAGRGADLQLISDRDAGPAGRGCQRTDCHAAGAGRRSGGLADRHQAAGHQRRRLLQRQLGASVRESRRRCPTSWRCWRSC